MCFSGQGTTNTEILFLTHIWESECLSMGAYLHCVADSFPCDSLIAKRLPSLPFLTLISFILFILILIHQFSLLTLCGSLFLGLSFCAFSSHGSGYIGQLSLLPVVHEQVNMLNFSWQFDGFENCHPQDITVVTATCHDVKVSYDMHQLYYT